MNYIFKAFSGQTCLIVYVIVLHISRITEAYENSIICHETPRSFLPNDATTIQTSVVVQSMQLDDATMEMRAHVTIKLSWETIRNVSIPTVQFSNAINTKALKHLIQAHPDDKFSSEKSYLLQIPCQLNFDYFPFDYQVCNMDLTLSNNNGCKIDDLKIKWHNESVKINSKLKFKNYFLKEYGTNVDILATELTSSTNNSLQILFFWERFYTSHLLRIVFPCSILVVISWLTLWISDKQQIPLRLSMELMIILITSITVASYNGTVPSVGYIKAIDIWTGTCLAFTSFTLIYTLVLRFTINFQASDTKLHSDTNKKYEETADELEKNSELSDSDDNCILKTQNEIKKVFLVPGGLDKLFRILYLTVFLTLVLYFWKIISNASENMETEYLKTVQNSNSILFY